MSGLKKPNSDRLIWGDIETNGLITTKGIGCIFEIALLITDLQFNEIARRSWVVHMPDADDWITNDFVRDMHTKNGLIEACKTSVDSLEEIEEFAISFIVKHNAVNSPLCGSSVHTDRKWLETHCPDLVELFHYRILDASGVRMAAQAIGAKIPSLNKPSNHRGMDDIYDSIQLAKTSINYGTGWLAIWLHLKAIGRLLCGR